MGEVSESPVVGMHLVVADLAAAIEDLEERGIQVGEPFHYGAAGKQAGIDPNHADYAPYAELLDPDHNVWLLQEVPSRTG